LRYDGGGGLRRAPDSGVLDCAVRCVGRATQLANTKLAAKQFDEDVVAARCHLTRSYDRCWQEYLPPRSNLNIPRSGGPL
jgi:hypothetical protein